MRKYSKVLGKAHRVIGLLEQDIAETAEPARLDMRSLLERGELSAAR